MDCDLFDTEENCNEDICSDISFLINKYPTILSKTRRTSQVWKDTEKVMRQIIGGTFLCSYDWDKKWLNRVLDKFPIEELKFDRNSLIDKVEYILDYVKSRQGSGCWWPDKIDSLRNFFCSCRRDGKYWSPFLEFCCIDCATVEMFRLRYGTKINEVLDDIMKEAWFMINYDTKISFYKGVEKFYDWYREKSETILDKSPNGEIYFGSFYLALRLVHRYNHYTRGIYPNFIGPKVGNWSSFVEFADQYGVKLNV